MQLKPLAASSQPAVSDLAVFVTKLQALDHLPKSKEVSDAEYEKGRTELFRRYMPDVLRNDARTTAGASQ